jgi:ADP-dependent NAD(P)H-hydrate dehydratase / NAD(P)H-hydrate epimerase
LYLLTRKKAQDLDRYLTDNIGIPKDLLIEHAAMDTVTLCRNYLKSNDNRTDKVVVFAGRGHNGMDAMACARLLFSEGYCVTVVETKAKSSDPKEYSLQKTLCMNMNIPVVSIEDYTIIDPHLILDGIFGTSYDSGRSLPEEIRLAIDRINDASQNSSYVIAIDIPSGVDPDTGAVAETAVHAHETMTFIYPKPGLVSYPGRKYAGEIRISKLAIPEHILLQYPEALTDHLWIDMTYAATLLCSRPQDGHKGIFGRIGLMGGSHGMAGAVCLAAKAALRCGCGLVYIQTEKEIIADCLSVVPEALIRSESSDVLKKTDVLAAGPGMEETAETIQRVFQLVKSYPKLILDATALNILAGDPIRTEESFFERKRAGLPPLILTPHAGEMERLCPKTKDENRIALACKAAEKYQSVVVLKGAGSVIADPSGQIAINSSGNSSMAKGGSGDILAGMMAALYSRMNSPFEAASLAVFLHGICGDLAAHLLGEYCAMPQDIVEMIPQAFGKISEQRGKVS